MASQLRRLVFEDNAAGRERFFLLYQGFITGGNSRPQRNMTTFRTEAKILDKFEKVSMPEVKFTPEPVETGFRSLLDGERVVELEQQEYDLVKAYFEQAPWNVSVTPRVVALADWYAAIPVTT